jgi:ribosomal protein S18 acetylase RimI-like enzyme
LISFVTEALSREHDQNAFQSGVAIFDRYLRELALQDIKRRVAGCFVACANNGEIAGYYTLAAASVPLDGLPPETAKKLPRYPAVPVMLLGRLAVASKFKGLGLGRALIADAAIRTDGFKIGAFALIVDAKDDHAVEFYRATGFSVIAGESRKLFLPIARALQL